MRISNALGFGGNIYSRSCNRPPVATRVAATPPFASAHPSLLAARPAVTDLARQPSRTRELLVLGLLAALIEEPGIGRLLLGPRTHLAAVVHRRAAAHGDALYDAAFPHVVGHSLVRE